MFARNLGADRLDKLKWDMENGGLALFARIHSDEVANRAYKAAPEVAARNIHLHQIDLPTKIDDILLSKLNVDPWLGDERLRGGYRRKFVRCD